MLMSIPVENSPPLTFIDGPPWPRNGVRGQGTSRGLRPFLSARWHQAGLTAILQPVALPANVDGRRVMQQPVQDRCGDDRITEDRSPVPLPFVELQHTPSPFLPPPLHLPKILSPHS